MSEITTEVHYYHKDLISQSGISATNAVFPPVVVHAIPSDVDDREIALTAGQEILRLVQTYRELRDRYQWRQTVFFFQPKNPIRIEANDQSGCFHLGALKQVGEHFYFGKPFYYLESLANGAGDRVVMFSKRDIHMDTKPPIDDRDTIAYAAWALQFIGGPWALFGDLFKSFYDRHGWYPGMLPPHCVITDCQSIQRSLEELCAQRGDNEEVKPND